MNGLGFRRPSEHTNQVQASSYYQVFARSNTSPAAMAKVAGRRWCIEAGFKLAKS
jgi:uncharacterized protein YdbL (DUF1318 family)